MLKVPMAQPKNIGQLMRADQHHQDLTELTLSKHAMSSSYLRSQKQLVKTNAYDASALGLHSQTFSMKPTLKGSGPSNLMKNRKRT